MILVLKKRSFGNRYIRLTMNETIAYLPGLSPVETKELCARFDGARLITGINRHPGILP